MPEPNGVVLDTSAVVAHFRRRANVFALTAGSPLSLPLIALGELWKGAEKSERPLHQRELIEEFLVSITISTPDEVTARYYGKLAASLESQGMIIPENDMWIAAIALQSGLPLLCRDAHFARVDGLTLIGC